MTKPLLTGVLKTWKEDRGFGFIAPDNGGRDIFIHITALAAASRRPMPGDVIHYQVTRDRHGKLRAINANIEGVAATQKGKQTKTTSNLLKIVLMAAAVMILVVSALFWYFRHNGYNLV